MEWALQEFERCLPLLQPAIEHTRGETTVESVRAQIESGAAQIWPSVNSCGVTKIITHADGKKVLHVWLVGGSLDEIKFVGFNYVIPWAKKQGCTRITISGRPGWLRAIKGLKHSYTVMGMDL